MRTSSLLLALLLILGAGCGPPPADPDAGPPADPDAGPGEVRCLIPAGAHPSVGVGVPAEGWRCRRDPRGLSTPRDVIVADDGSVFVTEFGAGRIVRVGDEIEVVAGGLVSPIGLRELSDGGLLVAEENLHSIARIDRATGSRSAIAEGLRSVTYLSLGPDGAAYVSSFAEVARTGTGIVWRVELSSGAASAYASGLHVPEGLYFEGSELRVAEWHLPSAVMAFASEGAEGRALSEGYTEVYGLCSDGEGGYFVGDHAGRIVHERSDGGREIVLEGIGKPGGIARAADGALWIAEFVGFGATGYLIRLDPP